MATFTVAGSPLPPRVEEARACPGLAITYSAPRGRVAGLRGRQLGQTPKVGIFQYGQTPEVDAVIESTRRAVLPAGDLAMTRDLQEAQMPEIAAASPVGQALSRAAGLERAAGGPGTGGGRVWSGRAAGGPGRRRLPSRRGVIGPVWFTGRLRS